MKKALSILAALVALASVTRAEDLNLSQVTARFSSVKTIASNSVATLVSTNIAGAVRHGVYLYNPGSVAVLVCASASTSVPIASVAAGSGISLGSIRPENSGSASIPPYYIASASNAVSSVYITEYWGPAPAIVPGGSLVSVP